MRLSLSLALAATLGSLVAMPVAAQQGAPDPAVIFSKAARAYKALSSMQAEFKMTIVDRALGNDDTKGMLYQAGSNKFAMLFSQPASQVFLIDGKDRWLYLPNINAKQVTKQPIATSPEYGVNIVGSFLDNPIEKYRLTYLRTEQFGGAQCYVVMADVIGRDMLFKHATVWYDVEDGLPRKLFFEETAGTSRTIELRNMKKNVTIAPGVFVFKVPSGVRVITP